MTHSQLRVLQAVAAGAGTLARIGNRAGLRGSASGGICDLLARAGFLTKRELDIDGKVEVSWALTDHGRAAVNDTRSLPGIAGKRNRDVGEIGCLVPIFGSNRMLAAEVGALLEGCTWVGIPFMGSLAEVPFMTARTIVAGDLHCHLVNLARTAADPGLVAELRRRLRKAAFHGAELRDAQAACKAREAEAWDGAPDVAWAADWFVSAWASRNGTAGTKGEFNAPLSVRWDAQGGDSVRRFRHAAEGLWAWSAVLERVTFVLFDAFEFLETKCKDVAKNGIYCDPPFPGPGEAYKIGFTGHERLAAVLAGFDQARVVVRLYETDFVRRLYPEGAWEYNRFTGRKSSNASSPELLLVRNGG